MNDQVTTPPAAPIWLTRLSRAMLPGAPVVALSVALVCYQSGLPTPACLCAAVALLCALWWIFECLDIAVVGLVPFVALPLLGVIDHQTVATSYGDTAILLLLGGFLLSAAMERSGAHRRIALLMVRAVGGRSKDGGSGRRLVLGFMMATAALSMWISNAATTLMMLPIALAVLQQSGDVRLRSPLLLGIAYAASVGGMATPIGTPPNVIFMGNLRERFGIEMPFVQWMSIGVPVSMTLLPIIWWLVTRGLKETTKVTMPAVGRIRPAEIRVLIIFAMTALLWIFRTGPSGGWSAWLPAGTMVGDSTVALAASLLLFICPAGERLGTKPVDAPENAKVDPNGQATVDRERERPSVTLPVERLLDWPTATKIPWGILIMFGGGLALADGFEASGLSAAIGRQLHFLAAAPPWLIVFAICMLVTFLTEITSSTATATLLMPVLAELSVQVGLPPELLMIPGTISCSCAFMLPVATAPNVIVFSAGGVRTDEMARHGLVINLIAAVVITVIVMWRLT